MAKLVLDDAADAVQGVAGLYPLRLISRKGSEIEGLFRLPKLRSEEVTALWGTRDLGHKYKSLPCFLIVMFELPVRGLSSYDPPL